MWLQRLQAHRILMNAGTGWLAGGISGARLDDCACGLVLLRSAMGGRWFRPLAVEVAHLLVCSDLSCSTICGDLGGGGIYCTLFVKIEICLQDVFLLQAEKATPSAATPVQAPTASQQEIDKLLEDIDLPSTSSGIMKFYLAICNSFHWTNVLFMC